MADHPVYCKKEIGELLPSMITPNFTPRWFNIWVSWANSDYCGRGGLWTQYSTTWEGCSVGTNIHELFHNFGLHHANKDGCEYEDSTSIMGYSRYISGLNTIDLLKQDLNHTGSYQIKTSQEILLAPVELLPESLHHNEVQHAIIVKKDRDPVYLSLRKGESLFPYSTRKVQPEYVFIHVKDEYMSDWVDTLEPGESTHIDGADIEYIEYENETARLFVDLGDYVSTPPEVINTELPIDFPTISAQHNGLWYAPEFVGQGFDIQVKNGRITIMWYTFNMKNVATRFYVAAGSIHDQHLQLYTTDGEIRSVGTIQASLQETTGIVNFNTTEHGRGSVHVKALSLNQDQRSGLFTVLSRPGDGFSLQYVNDTAVMYWFTRGVEPIHVLRDGTILTQRWFLFYGPPENMDIYEVTGGKFLQFNQVEVTHVGTASMDKNMQLTIHIETEDLYPSHYQLQLERLF
jgi:hypothetical protein